MSDPKETTTLPDNVKTLNFSVEQLPASSDAVPVIDKPAEEVKLPALDPKEGAPVDATEKPVEDKVVKPADKKEVVPTEKKETEKPEGELTVEEKEKKEDKPTGAARFLKPPKGATDKPADKTVQGAATGDVDFKKYSSQEQTVLKNMSVQSRRFVAQVLDQNKELARLKDGQWFQHPNAYVLHPDYAQARSQVQMAKAEGAYWAEQLELCKDGKDVTPLLKFDDKGEPVYGQPIKANGQVEEHLRQALSDCNRVAAQKEAEMGNMKKNFKGAMDSDLSAINQERENRFEWVKNPELLKYSVSVDDGKGGQVEKTIDQVRKDVISIFPPYMSGHPAVHTVGDMMVALILAKAEIAELQNGKQVEAIKKDEEKEIEPSSQERVRGVKPSGKFGGVKSFSVEGAGVEGI